MGVGLVTDAELCEKIYKRDEESAVVFWKVEEDVGGKEVTPEIHEIEGSDSKEILNSVLSFLPNPKLLDEADFRVRDV